MLIALTKNSTIAAVIGVSRTFSADEEDDENEAAIFVVGGIFAVGFVILTLPMGLIFGKLSKRFEVPR